MIGACLSWIEACPPGPRSTNVTGSIEEGYEVQVRSKARDAESTSPVVVIGVDAHKRTHTFVAVDQAGRKLGERTLPTTSEGHLQCVEWAAQWPAVVFALEDCRHLTRRLEGDLLGAGLPVVRVPAADGV